MKRLIMLCLLFAIPAYGQNAALTVATPQAGTNILSWDASPSALTMTITYNIYRKDASCSSATGTFVKLNGAPIVGLTFTDSAVPSGKVCYAARAFDGDIESVDSNRVSLPQPLPPGNVRKTG